MNLPNNPSWFGRRYPTWDDLLELAGKLGCRVGSADIGDQAVYVAGEANEPPVIVLPHDRGLLGHWLFAHELAHLVMHSGPKSLFTYRRDEQRANRWAACALIPRARIDCHANASIDAMIAALSAHYEDIPLEKCSLRTLAAMIARHRLRALEEVA